MIIRCSKEKKTEKQMKTNPVCKEIPLIAIPEECKLEFLLLKENNFMNYSSKHNLVVSIEY